MKRVIGPRASTILFNVLRTNSHKLNSGYVVLPSNVCPIVPVTFLKARIRFKFIDIDPISQCLDLNLLRDEILNNQNCTGVLFVHSYGNRQDSEKLFLELRSLRQSLFLIDDRCIGVPEIELSAQNSQANLNLYSTGYAKYVEFGYGGFGFLSEETPYQEQNGDYCQKDHESLVLQMNSCIQNQSLFEYTDNNWLEWEHQLNEKSYFEKVAAQIPRSHAQKSLLNSIYAELLPAELQMPSILCIWRFNLQVDDKKKLLEAIFNAGLFASSHYASVSKVFGGTSAPVAEGFHNRMLNLFNDHRFTESDAVKVCEIINNALK